MTVKQRIDHEDLQNVILAIRHIAHVEKEYEMCRRRGYRDLRGAYRMMRSNLWAAESHLHDILERNRVNG